MERWQSLDRKVTRLWGHFSAIFDFLSVGWQWLPKKLIGVCIHVISWFSYNCKTNVFFLKGTRRFTNNEQAEAAKIIIYVVQGMTILLLITDLMALTSTLHNDKIHAALSYQRSAEFVVSHNRVGMLKEIQLIGEL